MQLVYVNSIFVVIGINMSVVCSYGECHSVNIHVLCEYNSVCKYVN